MRLSNIKLPLSRMTFAQLRELLARVLVSLAGNIQYTNPNPTLLAGNADLTIFTDAITAWGPPGNRGSQNDRVALLAARAVVKQDLFQLAVYCENTTPGNVAALTGAGWTMKAIPRQSVGKLGAVGNLRQVYASNILAGTLKIKFTKPLDTVGVKVSGYRIMRGLTSDSSLAVQVAIVTDTMFLDVTPGVGLRYYWVIPFNASGDGVMSDTCVASAALLPA